MSSTVSTDTVVVLDRHRVDLGDIGDLAASIAHDGLLHPIVVTNDGRLIAGHRRLEACRSLGWTEVPVTFIEDVTDAAQLLRMERDENTCRKDMTPSEKVSLGRALEELERPKAKEAQVEGAREGAAITNRSAPFVPPNERRSTEKFDTREVVAPAVGMSTATYSRAKQLVTAAERGDEQAKAAVEEMDRTGKVTAPYEAWKGHKVNQGDAANATRQSSAAPAPEHSQVQQTKWDRVREMAEHGHTSAQIARAVDMSEGGLKAGAKREGIDIRADRIVGSVRRLDMRRVIEQTVIELESIASTTNNLISVDGIRAADIDRDEIQTWVDSLTQSLKALSKARNTIKESIS